MANVSFNHHLPPAINNYFSNQSTVLVYEDSSKTTGFKVNVGPFPGNLKFPGIASESGAVEGATLSVRKWTEQEGDYPQRVHTVFVDQVATLGLRSIHNYVVRYFDPMDLYTDATGECTLQELTLLFTDAILQTLPQIHNTLRASV